MFKWDGTNITGVISKSSIYSVQYNKKEYWIIRYVDPGTNQPYEETCLVRPSKFTVPVLIDELKPIFGLQKLGTHWCVHRDKTKILIKIERTPEGHINEELKLNEIEKSSNLLKLQVQEIFTFRELLGITCSYESSIIIRNNGYSPVSFYEPNMLMTDKKVIPYKVLDKWFKDTSIDDVVKKLLKIHSIDRIGVVLHRLRVEFDSIVERTDKRNIGFKTFILNRITERLQTTLS